MDSLNKLKFFVYTCQERSNIYAIVLHIQTQKYASINFNDDECSICFHIFSSHSCLNEKIVVLRKGGQIPHNVTC